MNLNQVMLTTIVALTLLMISGVIAAEKPPYRDPNLPVDQRIADLLGRMTLEEKVAQLCCVWKTESQARDENGNFLEDEMRPLIANGIGHWARINQDTEPREGAELANLVQRFVIENNRLGIPAIFHDEGCHGFMARRGTHYPMAIGLASAWDPEMTEKIYTTVAKEMRARGVAQALTPVVGLGRDPRWGRVEETWGEDPYLISRIAVSCIRGFQGYEPIIDRDHVIATVKHYAVYSMPERGINFSPGNYSERVIRTDFLQPFRAAVMEAGVRSIMASYNEIDGIPSHSSTWLLQDVLREEMGFDGYVVADYSGIAQLYNYHFVAHDKYEAARMALEAGVDIELPDNECYSTLVEQVRDGRMSEAMVDRSAARVLRAKFELGLFENPYVDPGRAEKVTNCKEHRELALDAARECLVLLKNENRTLPLDASGLSSLAVIGPNAKGIHLGGYSYEPRSGVDVLTGIQERAGGKVDIRYAEGCRITEGEALWLKDDVTLADPATNHRLIREAVDVVKTCDAAVLVIGGNEATCREGWAPTHLGDRNSIELVGEQEDLLKAVLETGVPTIVILINGKPLAINYAAEHVPAIIEAWYPGQEGGTAIAEVLFGDVNPSGKLPITIPRSTGHIPAYYSYKPSVVNDYLFASNDPLYPFGHGLSYTTFTYSQPKVSPAVIGPAGETEVSVEVTNTGNRAGDEVVQLYIRDKVSSVTRPVQELKGFKRISLKPGERKTVTMKIGPEALRFLDRNMNWTVEPGEFEIMVGTSSAEYKTTVLKVEDR